MAAGGSAPELFTSVVGVLIAKSDIGFGTIVGSAVFNVLFVIAMCAFVTNNLQLSWWPLTRDSVYYCFSIILLVMLAADNKIHVLDSVLLLLCYFGYVTIMYFNETIQDYVSKSIDRDRFVPVHGFRKRCRYISISPMFNNTIYLIILANLIVIGYELIVGTDSTSNTTDNILGANSTVTPVPTMLLENSEKELVSTLNDLFSAVFISEMVFKIYALGFFGFTFYIT